MTPKKKAKAAPSGVASSSISNATSSSSSSNANGTNLKKDDNEDNGKIKKPQKMGSLKLKFKDTHSSEDSTVLAWYEGTLKEK